jgi:hypothetical protein
MIDSAPLTTAVPRLDSIAGFFLESASQRWLIIAVITLISNDIYNQHFGHEPR